MPKESHLHPDQMKILKSWLSGLIPMLQYDENLGVHVSLNTGVNLVGNVGNVKNL